MAAAPEESDDVPATMAPAILKGARRTDELRFTGNNDDKAAGVLVGGGTKGRQPPLHLPCSQRCPQPVPHDSI